MKHIILLALLCCGLTAKADMPGEAYQYDRYSLNGKFYFKSIPFNNFDETDFGKTIVYETATNRELYRINNYLPTESFISNTGKSLATIKYWMWGHSGFEKQVLIEIFIDAKPSTQLFVDDLILNKSKLQHTVSHTLWYDKLFLTGDTLNILTLENRIIRIDLNTGKILKKDFAGKNFWGKEKHSSNTLEEPKTIYYFDIKYPEGYMFPDLSSGKSFRKSLIEALNKKEVKEHSDCTYYIMIYGTIDKSGKCEIFMLETSVNRVENAAFEKQVKDWITTQEYKINLIPQNCDKWVFKEYFYLK